MEEHKIEPVQAPLKTQPNDSLEKLFYYLWIVIRYEENSTVQYRFNYWNPIGWIALLLMTVFKFVTNILIKIVIMFVEEGSDCWNYIKYPVLDSWQNRHTKKPLK